MTPGPGNLMVRETMERGRERRETGIRPERRGNGGEKSS